MRHQALSSIYVPTCSLLYWKSKLWSLFSYFVNTFNQMKTFLGWEIKWISFVFLKEWEGVVGKKRIWMWKLIYQLVSWFCKFSLFFSGLCRWFPVAGLGPRKCIQILSSVNQEPPASTRANCEKNRKASYSQIKYYDDKFTPLIQIWFSIK